MFNTLRNKIVRMLGGHMYDTKENMPPDNFFDTIKDSQNTITEEALRNAYAEMYRKAEKFIEIGQIESAERITFHLKNIRREQDAVRAGYNTYVYRDDLEFFIDKVSKTVVKITELKHFEREIPDAAAKEIQRAKPLFDEIYIVYTDYTGKIERQIKAEDQVRDPIAFGAFRSDDGHIWNHRFYFIIDWEDEYCDLTLDKFISEMTKAGYIDKTTYKSGEIKSVEALERKLNEAVANEKKRG